MFRFGQKTLVAIYALLLGVPITLVVMTSFKTTQDFYRNPVGFPDVVVLQNYAQMFQQNNLMVYFKNSVIVTASTMFLVIFLASLISYVVMRTSGWKSAALYGFFIVGMMLPAQVNMIPLYGVVDRLGLLNSLFGLILVSTTAFMPVAVFIIGGFMKTLSKDMIEAASIDGASEWKMYSKIVMPLSAPSLATAAIFIFVMVWNDLLYPLLFISSRANKTLPLALLDFRGEYFTNYPMIFAGVLLAAVPVVVTYIFLQKYFVAGMTAGASKG